MKNENEVKQEQKEEKEEKKEKARILLEEMKGVDPSELAKIGCKEKLDYYDTLKIIGKDEMALIEINAIREENNMFNCPKCSAIFIIDKNVKNKYLRCPQCHEVSCRICLQDAHKGGPCNLNERQNVTLIR